MRVHAPRTLPLPARKLQKQFLNPYLLRAYFLKNLPLAAFAGLRLTRLDAEMCEVTVPYSWRTTNPFGSIYFAALTMAAELSTGALALVAAKAGGVPVSALPVGFEAHFEKKSSEITTFRASCGAVFLDAVDATVKSGEGVEAKATSVGTKADGSVVARFDLTWSFKVKSSGRSRG